MTSTSPPIAHAREWSMGPVGYQRLESRAMLADELIEVHENPRQVVPFTERYPALTAAQGYEAALALHRHRLALGWRPVGRKIGFTNRTIWPRYGVYEPIWGTVYDRTVASSQGNHAEVVLDTPGLAADRKSTRLNSSHD